MVYPPIAGSTISIGLAVAAVAALTNRSSRPLPSKHESPAIRQKFRNARASLFAPVDGFVRFSRAAQNVGMAVVEYSLSLKNDLHGEQAAEEALHHTHQRCANRLLKLCLIHGGIYTKFGQYVSTLDHVLPEEYIDTLSALHDRAVSQPWSKVKHIFQDELKTPPDVLFKEIDEKPLAAASLAQVHRAIRREGGEEVAVKIQYPHLERQVFSDLKALRLLANCVGYCFPQFQYTWVVGEFEENMRHELDFRQEGYNAERMANHFRKDRRVYVPKIHWDMTTPRILTMEYIRGLKVDDTSGLCQAGIERRAVSRLLSYTFGRMIHVHGFVHCDPHPGNLLVRTRPIDEKNPSCREGPLQLVILDHGMYRRIEPKLRTAYCRLWRALITLNVEEGHLACAELLLPPNTFNILSLALTFRPAESQFTPLGRPLDDRDIERLKNDLAVTGMKDINKFLHSLPRDLLWIFRCTNILRNLSATLGATARDRLETLGEAAIEGLYVSNEGLEDHIIEILHQRKEKEEETGTAEAKCRRPHWTELPGRKTLNLPIASEIPLNPTILRHVSSEEISNKLTSTSPAPLVHSPSCWKRFCSTCCNDIGVLVDKWRFYFYLRLMDIFFGFSSLLATARGELSLTFASHRKNLNAGEKDVAKPLGKGCCLNEILPSLTNGFSSSSAGPPTSKEGLVRGARRRVHSSACVAWDWQNRWRRHRRMSSADHQ